MKELIKNDYSTPRTEEFRIETSGVIAVSPGEGEDPTEE